MEVIKDMKIPMPLNYRKECYHTQEKYVKEYPSSRTSTGFSGGGILKIKANLKAGLIENKQFCPGIIFAYTNKHI